MGNLHSLFKKQNHNLILNKKCIHCGEVFTSARKRRKHELICPQKSNHQQLDVYSITR